MLFPAQILRPGRTSLRVTLARQTGWSDGFLADYRSETLLANIELKLFRCTVSSSI